jgi:catechol 2,3-dioxygenase-like lactoylglutathione lyase family enzyme
MPMKRLHVHVAVADIDRSIGFYSTLFSTPPSVVRPDYAKWMLEDPRVNFAISTHAAAAPGIDHLGIQVEDEAELAQVQSRLDGAEGPVLNEGETVCCYHQSKKSWIGDPSGIRWEAFLTRGEATVYGSGPAADAWDALAPADGACCAPAPAAATACCAPAPAASSACRAPAAE